VDRSSVGVVEVVVTSGGSSVDLTEATVTWDGEQRYELPPQETNVGQGSLVVPDPEVSGEVDSLVQTHDLPVTILDLLGLGAEARNMDGQSTVSLLTGEQEVIRDVVVTGFHPHRTRCVRDGTWSYLRHPEEQTDELYHVEQDSQERTNRIETDTEVARRLLSNIGQQFEPSQSGPFVKDFLTVMARHDGQRRPDPDDEV